MPPELFSNHSTDIVHTFRMFTAVKQFFTQNLCVATSGKDISHGYIEKMLNFFLNFGPKKILFAYVNNL